MQEIQETLVQSLGREDPRSGKWQPTPGFLPGNSMGRVETNGNDSTTIQYLLDMTKTVLRGEFTAIQSTSRNKKKHQIDSLTLHLKQLEKEEQQQKKTVEGKKS